MIYVMAKSLAEADRWRRRAGLPRTHARYLTTDAARGCEIHPHEIVQLRGCADLPDPAILAAVLPALVGDPRKIPVVE